MDQAFVDDTCVRANIRVYVCSREHKAGRTEWKDVCQIADFGSSDVRCAVSFVRFRFRGSLRENIAFRDSLSEEPTELIDPSEAPRSLQNPRQAEEAERLEKMQKIENEENAAANNLALAIQRRNEARASQSAKFFDSLIDKYANMAGKSKRKSSPVKAAKTTKTTKNTKKTNKKT
ncbi:unnamed protein product [Heterotrigona itama]|uniref:Uncharacterized protein n=1 Tax=Heterotrigona itama TaxID=395501 RepID=A0A6V7HF78_9HYME|nr:unnamed protein product [Heterotrigona itama]